MLRIYKHYHGDKIEFPIRLYRPEYVADLVEQVTDRKKRAKISRASGYTVRAIENIITKRKKENGTEDENG
jgi:hypothetical protein